MLLVWYSQSLILSDLLWVAGRYWKVAVGLEVWLITQDYSEYCSAHMSGAAVLSMG